MSTGASTRKPNRLIHETSPYLLQHAYNPVDWYPWGMEALQTAKAQNRPILLSIGYSACHWCHVMERESFESESIAALLNRHFVCIKVDREERPDLDEIYMAATVAMNHGQGGWPMTVFLTPEQQPFFAGTYFPPDDRWGRPGFSNLLGKIAEVWNQDAAGLRSRAQELTARLEREWQVPNPVSISDQILDTVVHDFSEEFDPNFGGFGSAPKFPPATGLSLLLRCYRRNRDAKALHMVTKTLDAMAAGGMYDHIGGGFARYSTDERWLVPHFEKMLYDNALLARAYLDAYQVTKQETYRDVVIEVLDYILREMTDHDGGFYSATDADSEGVEGKFFVWTPDQIRQAVNDDEDVRRFCTCYDITAHGNWEHTNIPNRMRAIDAVARELDVTVDELRETVKRVRPILYETRKGRVPPGLDDKIITAWNGMMISAMAEAGRVLGHAKYVVAARNAADFLLRVHRAEGRLLRTSRKGRAHLDAVLEDYAYLGEGLVDLYEAGGGARYLEAASTMAEQLLESFQDSDHGGFFTTGKTHETLILRGREGADGATPSGNAVAATLLARLSFHLDRPDYRAAAIGAVRAYGKQMTRYPRAFAKSLALVDLLTEGPIEIALIGRNSDPRLLAMQQAIKDVYLPNRIIAITDIVDGTSTHPLLTGKKAVNGQAALYLCRHFSCPQPLTDPLLVVEALQAASNPSGQRSGVTRLQGPLLDGSATVEGTARYASRLVNQPKSHGRFEYGFTALGGTGLTASRLGFGCYRLDGSNPEFGAALSHALRSGVNVIDTSTNYMDGESERLVGSVIGKLVGQKDIARDEIIVVSKIGYVQGQNLKQAEVREQAGRPYPDMVKYGEGIWHCIHPEFLAEQLDASLDRLGLGTLDVCLLHNPEYFLSEAAHRSGTNLDEQRVEFSRRLEKAFQYFESQVSAGRIRWYGVSSNTVTGGPTNADSTSLSDMLEAANGVARAQKLSRHHFAVLQCPMNLFEAAAWTMRNAGGQNLLELAQASHVAVLLNRPLNAMPIPGMGVLRLADFHSEGEAVDIEEAFRMVESLEEEYRSKLAPSISQSKEGTKPADFFRWASELARIRPHIQGIEHWEQIEHQMIAPQVNQVLQAIPRLLSGTSAEEWDAWRDRYVPLFLTLLRGFRHEAIGKSRARVAKVAASIDSLLPESHRKESFSRKALWVLASTPGVTCVLNGMRTGRYVDDSIAVLGWELLKEPGAVYEQVKQISWS